MVVSQEILDTFIYEVLSNSFAVSDPLDQDSLIGYYSTRAKAEKALTEWINKEKIDFE
jgi:hypothetical protein